MNNTNVYFTVRSGKGSLKSYKNTMAWHLTTEGVITEYLAT